MIQVNLLPPEKRPPEGTSPARLTAIILGVLIPFLGLLLDFTYMNKTNQLNQDTKELTEKNANIQKEIDEQVAITKQIDDINKKTAAVDGLRKNRMLWGRFHYRFIQMATALDALDTQLPGENNAVLRSFQLRKDGNDKFNIEMSVMVMGTPLGQMSVQEVISRRQAEFMNVLNRYSGASLADNPDVLRLAVELQGINPPIELSEKEMESTPSWMEIQRKKYEKRQEAVKIKVAEVRKKHTALWVPKLAGKPPQERQQIIDRMLSDADELVRINNFTGLIFEKITFKALAPTSVDYPAPPAGTEFINPQTAANKIDFVLSFRLSPLVAPK